MVMKILGIVNITEDSFSDGGKYLAADAALAHARNLANDADILDLGAASSNPDAKAGGARCRDRAAWRPSSPR